LQRRKELSESIHHAPRPTNGRKWPGYQNPAGIPNPLTRLAQPGRQNDNHQ